MEGKAQPFAQKQGRGVDSFKRSMRRSVRRSKGRGAIGAVARGVVVGASITVIAIALLALLLNWWDASDRAITAINQVVKFASILAGVTSALGESKSGTLRGMCVGFAYMALGILCHQMLMGGMTPQTGYLVDLGMGVAAGGLFGMILSGRKAG